MINEKINFNTIKGLQSGLFCMHVTGNSKERDSFAKKQMASLIEDGKIKRFIRPAPRSARYRIDWYHAPHIKTEDDCLDLKYEYTWGQALEYLFKHGMDESFNPMDLKEKGKEFEFGDFTLCYAPFSKGKNGIEEFYQFSLGKSKIFGSGYYLKFKGEIDKKKLQSLISW